MKMEKFIILILILQQAVGFGLENKLLQLENIFLRYRRENEKNKINIKPVFKESKDMPILEDLYNILGKDKKTKKMQIKLIPFIKGSLNFFNNYTNIELNNKLINKKNEWGLFRK